MLPLLKPINLAMSKRLGGITATGIIGATGITAIGDNAVDASSPQLHLNGWGGPLCAGWLSGTVRLVKGEAGQFARARAGNDGRRARRRHHGTAKSGCRYRKIDPTGVRRQIGHASSHGRYPQTDLLGGHRSVPIKSVARSGNPGTAPATQRAAQDIAEAARVQLRSLV